VAQKRHFEVFSHKNEFFIDKRLLYSFLMLELSAVRIFVPSNGAEMLLRNITLNQKFRRKKAISFVLPQA